MSISNIHSLKRKKYKRAVNKLVRAFNKTIQNDWLWNGRFVMSQYCAYFTPYADHSGADYLVYLKLVDTKTKTEAYKAFDNYKIEWYMWEWANECIVEKWHIWDEKPNPNEQARLEGRKPIWR